MLLRFAAENFLSIRDRQEFSLVATSLKDEESGLFRASGVPNGAVLPGAVIYGANASGKSNFVGALEFARQAILHSHNRGGPDSKINRKAFELDKSYSRLNSRFEFDFLHKDIRYHFGFEASDREFKSEWLYSFPLGRRQMLYERTSPQEVRFGRALKGRNRIIADLMRPNSLFMSVARQNSHEEITAVSKFFDDIVFVDAISVAGPEIIFQFSGEDRIDARVIRFLKEINTGVVGYRTIERENSAKKKAVMSALSTALKSIEPNFEFPDGDADTRKEIELSHKGVDGSEIYFDISAESSGTRRLLVLLSDVFKALDRGLVVVVDEIDASLHTQICETVIRLFFDGSYNRSGAQLIATTHDTNLMRSSALRRDQVWFAEKDDVGATSLYPLSDIQTRQSDNIEKGYLQGRFGAIPFSGSISSVAE